MIRILQIVNIMNRAGLETMLMNYYRHIDRSKIQFDFLTHRPEAGDYDEEIKSLGGKIYYAPRLYPQNYPKYFKWMKKFFQEHPEYNIVHSHIDSMSYLPLKAAKKSKVPIRIAHSHSSSIDKDFKRVLKQYFRAKIDTVATNCIACGEVAGKFLFKNCEFIIIPNAVDANLFAFNQQKRNQKRMELEITNAFVIGHVGRFSYPKNHSFLVDIFYELHKQNKDTKLLLVGEGENCNLIKEKVERLNLQDAVAFLGNRSDVNELYQAMDLFIMPSLFEGIPVVGVEAQFADLPCLFSDKVPNEVKFNEKSKFVKLEDGAKKWASEIINVINTNEVNQRGMIADKHYDIQYAHKLLEDYYFDLSSSNNNRKT